MGTSIHPSIPVLSPSFVYYPSKEEEVLGTGSSTIIVMFRGVSFNCLLPFLGCTLDKKVNGSKGTCNGTTAQVLHKYS